MKNEMYKQIAWDFIKDSIQRADVAAPIEELPMGDGRNALKVITGLLEKAFAPIPVENLPDIETEVLVWVCQAGYPELTEGSGRWEIGLYTEGGTINIENYYNCADDKFLEKGWHRVIKDEYGGVESYLKHGYDGVIITHWQYLPKNPK